MIFYLFNKISVNHIYIIYMFPLDDFHQSVRIFSLKLLVRVMFLNIFALMLENASLFGWGLVSKQIQESLCFLLLIGFMPMRTKHINMIRLHLALEKRSRHALDLDFTSNLVVALEDLTEIFATAFIASSLESPGTASSSLS